MSEIGNNESRGFAVACAGQWRGTPHRNRIAVMGKGIDCIRFVVEVLIAAEIVERAPLPSYPLAWGIAAPENKLAPALAACLDCERLSKDDWHPKTFDIVIWKVGMQSNHCGIVLNGWIWHVSTMQPVGPTSIDRALDDIQEIVRILSPGWTSPPSEISKSLL